MTNVTGMQSWSSIPDDSFFTTSSFLFDTGNATNVTSTNVTTEASPPVLRLPVQGLGTWIFHAIHLTAITTCAVSTVVSATLLVYLARKRKGSFFQCTVGERLVVYLCICDVGFSFSHGLDHVVMYILKDHTPQPTCSVIAYFVQEFTLGQSLVVNIAAVTAIIVVVRERRANFGKYDWRLIAYAFGFPAVLGIFIGAFNWYGAVGAWCFMDMTKRAGQILNTFYILAMCSVFVANSICYVIVWIKIQRVSSMMKEISDDKSAQNAAKRSKRSAQSMACIVLAYLCQWCLYVALTIWSLFGAPVIELLLADVFVCNLGGVFNVFAYSLIKKRYEAKDAKKRVKEPPSTITGTTKLGDESLSNMTKSDSDMTGSKTTVCSDVNPVPKI